MADYKTKQIYMSAETVADLARAQELSGKNMAQTVGEALKRYRQELEGGERDATAAPLILDGQMKDELEAMHKATQNQPDPFKQSVFWFCKYLVDYLEAEITIRQRKED